MPSKPKKPCAYPGCPVLVTGRYCKEHTRKTNSSYEKFSRDKNAKHRYGRAWKRIRDKYAAEHPFYELCFERVLQFQPRKFIISCRLVKAVHMPGVI